MLEYIKKLTSVSGVSGEEAEVRNEIYNVLKECYTSVTVDPLGNLIVYKKGNISSPGILLSAHMDEVGIMVTGINDDGTMKFKTIGGIDSKILPSKQFLLGKNKIPAIVGFKPIHLQDEEEFNKQPDLKKLYLDIGTKGKKETEELVSVGDSGVFTSNYHDTGERVIAKALDDRVGCAILLSLAMEAEDYRNDVYFAFTTMEEVGIRGSSAVVAQVENIGCVIVAEGTTCADVPGTKGADMCSVMDSGPVFTIMDRSCISDRGLNEMLVQTAVTNDIPYQFKSLASGGNDAASYQTAKTGYKVASVSVPCRYLHSPSGIMSKKDIMNAYKLIKAFLKRGVE